MTALRSSGNDLRPVGARFALATTWMSLIGLCQLLPTPAMPDQGSAAVAGATSGTHAAPARYPGMPATETARPNGTGTAARKAGGNGGQGLTLPGVLRGC